MGGPMLRLLHVERAWAQRRVAPEATLTVALEVQDAQLPENGGRWRLVLRDGGVEVERGGGSADLALALDVQTLSRIFVGALPPSAAVRAGVAEVEGADRLPDLDRALQLPQPWTFDRY
jgi:predicted acetyltransferase